MNKIPGAVWISCWDDICFKLKMEKRMTCTFAAQGRRMQDAAMNDGAPPDERFGGTMDRWEPGSDFEEKTVARSQRSRRSGEAGHSTVQAVAEPSGQASDARTAPAAAFAEAEPGAVASQPAASNGGVDRLELRLNSMPLSCVAELVFCRCIAALCGAFRTWKLCDTGKLGQVLV